MVLWMLAVQLMIRSSLRHTSKRAFPWRYCSVLALALLGATPALALDPNKRITQYAHAAWRIGDGFFRTSPSASCDGTIFSCDLTVADRIRNRGII